MSLPNTSQIAEFHRYRFARQGGGSLAELASARRDERSFLVLDCLRYRFARLHIFEGLANDFETANRFTRQLNTLAGLKHPLLNPILNHGRDDSELYYVERFIDGEMLNDYLRRIGGLPESAAIQVTLDLIEMLLVVAPRPNALENFDLGHLTVSADDESPTGFRLHFSDYSGWNEPAIENPVDLVRRLGLQLYNLLGGFVFRSAPGRPFFHEAQHTSEALRNLIGKVLADDPESCPHRTLASLASALRPLMAQAIEREGEHAKPPAPRRFLSEWLTEGRGLDAINLGGDYHYLPESGDARALAFEATVDRASLHGKVRFQLFPNWDSIPREGWLEQHHSSLRRGGRGLPNQLGIVDLEPSGRCLLIGEESVPGFSVEALVEERGPLEFGSALALARKIGSAIDVMEKTAGAAPVWWLPARNAYLVTGDPNPASLDAAMRAHGDGIWQRLPVRLRLHQTANDLVEGLTFPESIMERINRSGKQGEPGRRTAVLLPLIWHLLTGKPMNWDNPLEGPAGIRLPEKAIGVLEAARLKLTDDPKTIHTSLINQLEPFVEGEPSRSDTATFGENDFIDGMVSEPVTLFELPKPSEKDHSEPDPVTATFSNIGNQKPGGTFLSNRPRRRSEIQRPTVPAEEIEKLGTIEDPLYAQAAQRQREVVEPPAIKSEGGALSLAPFSLGNRPEKPAPISATGSGETDENNEAPSDPVEETAPAKSIRRRLFFRRPIETEPIPESSGTEEDKTIPFEIPPATEPEATEPEATEPEATEPEATESAPASVEKTEPTRDDDWLSSFRQSEEQGSGNDEPETTTTEDDDGPMSFFSFLATQSIAAEDSEACQLERRTKDKKPVEATESNPENRSTASEATSEDLSPAVSAGEPQDRPERFGVTYFRWFKGDKENNPPSETIDTDESESPAGKESTSAIEADSPTESATTQPDAGEPRLPAKPTAKLLTSAGQIIGAAALIWGITYLLVAFAGDVERQMLAENFSPIVRTDYLKNADPISEVSGQPESEAIAPAEIDEETAASDPRAAARLADHYLPIDRPLALKWLRRSAEFGHSRHRRQLGLILAEVPEQLPEAVSWLQKAALQGDIEACFYYGAALLRGLGVSPDPETALTFLEKAAEARDGRALDLLGICLAEGNGCRADPVAAFHRFEKAVEAGNAHACYNLAVRYAKGLGTRGDEPLAARYFRLGAEKGDAECMHAYGRCLESGFGVEANFEDAVAWMKKAAALGQPDALAWCLRQGLPMGVASVE
ncbi:MAG: SEL1-like repeat protein [Verrucomicrobiae bacterium]|nr:SEL1-like repeat protein [Verrucomicrobiae bacterium]